MPYHGDGTITWDDPCSTQFYHGSPQRLTTLWAGSSVTRNMQLAKAFSHRPTEVWSSRQGEVHHNGSKPGYLYVSDEELAERDLQVHPACDSDDPWELVVKRDVRLTLIARLAVQASAEEC